MARELRKMGGMVEERDDGLVIEQSDLRGCEVDGHYDHRVVMALAVAGMCAQGETTVTTAEAALVTYPGFVEDFRGLGANIDIVEE
jgi:3-phosphoshikimate 1-carboxyvinyltransferase